MKPAILLAALLPLFSCNNKAPDYPEQLKTIFSNRVTRLDSVSIVDKWRAGLYIMCAESPRLTAIFYLCDNLLPPCRRTQSRNI